MRRASRRWPWAGVAWWKNSCTCPVKVGDVDTDMRLICREGLTEAFLLARGEPVARGAQKKPDLIEGILLAPTVTSRVLLDATTVSMAPARRCSLGAASMRAVPTRE